MKVSHSLETISAIICSTYAFVACSAATQNTLSLPDKSSKTSAGGAAASISTSAGKGVAVSDDSNATERNSDAVDTTPSEDSSQESPSPEAPQNSANMPMPVLTPGVVTIKNVEFPASIKSDDKVSITAEASNTGSPVKGIFGALNISAKTTVAGFPIEVNKNADIESTDSIPNGNSTNKMGFSVPTIKGKNIDAKVCVNLFSDREKQKRISQEICKNVKVNP